MRVVVTGAAGFLGSRLADALLDDDGPLAVTELVLTDTSEPAARADPRVSVLALDLRAEGAAARLVRPGLGALLHLAAVVSGRAEDDFDLGLAVNLDATRALLEAARRSAPAARFVLASTVGVYGPPAAAPDEPVDERTAPTPRTSYGAAKAAAELLVLEYSRRGFVDGRVVRLPTVTVRGGAANAAVTSFASGVVREPLAGREATVPVPPRQEVWVCSPTAAVRNLARAAALPRARLPEPPRVNLPGLRVSVREMVEALRAAAGEEAAARVRFELDERIAAMVASFPVRFDDGLARRLGFEADESFADIIRKYMRDELGINMM